MNPGPLQVTTVPGRSPAELVRRRSIRRIQVQVPFHPRPHLKCLSRSRPVSNSRRYTKSSSHLTRRTSHHELLLSQWSHGGGGYGSNVRSVSPSWSPGRNTSFVSHFPTHSLNSLSQSKILTFKRSVVLSTCRFDLPTVVSFLVVFGCLAHASFVAYRMLSPVVFGLKPTGFS